VDTFRLILIFIGVAILVAIYFYEQRRREEKRQGRRGERRDEEDLDLGDLGGMSARRDDAGVAQDPLGEDFVVGPARQVTGVGPDAAAPPPSAEAAGRPEGEGRPVPEAETGREPAPSAAPAPLPQGMQEKIVALHVMAPTWERFQGHALQDALREAGLSYGHMQIYHRDVNGYAQAVFSVANILEPGTFDPEQMDNFTTPGVVMFMRLPGPARGSEALDDMLKTAQGLADSLGGEVRDEQRNPLSRQGVTLLREQVAEYEYKVEVARRREGLH
jgi:cell division protein ZipA